MSMSTETEQIFERLAAPFAAEELRTRRHGDVTLSYITARTARRRLNDVLGPQNWSCRLEPAEHWVKCVLTITLPDGKLVTREALGGYPRMPLEEDKVKGGDSDSFKRVCATFGIAEYLYGDEPVVHEMPATERPASRPDVRPAPPRPAPHRPFVLPPEERTYDNSRPPTSGKALYRWCIEHEKLCGLPEKRIINLVDDHFGPASEYGPEVPRMWRDWSENHVHAAALFVMDYLAQRPEYQGAFDAYLPRGRDRNHVPAGEDEAIPF